MDLQNDWILTRDRSSALSVPYDKNILQLFWFSTKPEMGVKTISVVRLIKRLRVFDPKTGAPIWLLYFARVRGARLSLRRRDRENNKKRLQRHRFDWESLGDVSGYLRRGKERFLKAVRSLGFKTQ